ncbi:hypothetical protein VTL71DRAFT_11274 [Oculimacula yallundae]|uniref:Uncharacterized protein n=1 Tax=Oculimacula yallundae TaxID=86028 RepID=A0ABR4CVZ0_9HELO
MSKYHLDDQGFELGDFGSTWLFADHSDNYDTTFQVNTDSTYGPPNSGSAVRVLVFKSPNSSAQLLGPTFDLCSDTVYIVTACYYVPIGYDASLCSFTLGVFGGAILLRRPRLW